MKPSFLQVNTFGGKEAQSLLQLSESWPCQIWLVGRMKFASLEANLCLGQGLLVNPILLFFLPPSERSHDMTEILLNLMLNLNSINQSIQINITTI